MTEQAHQMLVVLPEGADSIPSPIPEDAPRHVLPTPSDAAGGDVGPVRLTPTMIAAILEVVEPARDNQVIEDYLAFLRRHVGRLVAFVPQQA